MTFKNELVELSLNARESKYWEEKEIWEALKISLRNLAKSTGECGANVILRGIPDKVINELRVFAKIDDIEFDYWNYRQEGKPDHSCGIIYWDSEWLTMKYPNKECRYIILVIKNDDFSVHTSILDTKSEISKTVY